MPNTAQEYDKVIDICQDIFVKKMQDYGTAWRILRPTSITDQIYIKANRIRSIEEKGITKVGEGIVPEFIGIINYSNSNSDRVTTLPKMKSFACIKIIFIKRKN